MQGRYQAKPALPYTPGTAVSGSVQRIGSGVDSVDLGDRVSVLSLAGGGFATHLVASAKGLVRLPVGLAAEVAATAIENYSTMAFALVSTRNGSAGRMGARAGRRWQRWAGGRGRRAGGRWAGHRGRVERGETGRSPPLWCGGDYADLKDQVRDLTAPARMWPSTRSAARWPSRRCGH